jgi:predicted DNA-binding transcriptional regulator AlpA
MAIEQLFKTEQVAEILGFATKTLSNQRVLGTGLPFIKIGNAVRYKKSDIETYIEENTFEHSGNVKVNSIRALEEV